MNGVGKSRVLVSLNGRSYKPKAHNQILRIRAEDLHIGDDVTQHFMLFSKPILPLSPLSGNSVVNTQNKKVEAKLRKFGGFFDIKVVHRGST
ncbi:hypothetical protein CASFOL_026578 [Castilleja foliolosa]|uniref:Uncharacterized protein n=1 Tax=Castilleja foliolosa TaxID=1961234 RepID=A0ABD3CJ53_9LAMI